MTSTLHIGGNLIQVSNTKLSLLDSFDELKYIICYHNWSVNGVYHKDMATDTSKFKPSSELIEIPYYDGIQDNILQTKNGLANPKYPVKLELIDKSETGLVRAKPLIREEERIDILDKGVVKITKTGNYEIKTEFISGIITSPTSLKNKEIVFQP